MHLFTSIMENLNYHDKRVRSLRSNSSKVYIGAGRVKKKGGAGNCEGKREKGKDSKSSQKWGGGGAMQWSM